MKLPYAVFAALLLSQDATAFSAHSNHGSKPATETSSSSRAEFLKIASAAAFASVAGVAASPGTASAFEIGGKIVYGGEEIMVQKEHGTSAKPVQENLLYGANNKLADKICNYNRCVGKRGARGATAAAFCFARCCKSRCNDTCGMDIPYGMACHATMQT